MSGRFDQILERRMESPAFRERYERTERSIARMQEILQRIDTERQEAGLTKSGLAERAGTNPAALRRLFTSGTSNPTLKTVLQVMDALGIQIEITSGVAPAEPRLERGRIRKQSRAGRTQRTHAST